ncbi:MAG: hypothetical protein ACI9ST_000876 [Psychrobacter glaciei]|jgi:hypothetical protein|uniref:hypothetical protein n=1 Tax=Psychrobacter glaciei TaxID=619771 RepID=UPI0039E5164B
MNVEIFNELYESFGVWAPVIIVSITLIRILLNPQKLREFMDTFSYARRKSIRDKEEALESKYLDSLTRQSIQQKLSEDHFYQAVGLRVDYYLRHVLLALCEYSQGEITLSNIKRSRLNLSYKNNKLEVSISKIERIFSKISFIVFIISTLSIVALFLYTIFLIINTGAYIFFTEYTSIFYTLLLYIFLMVFTSSNSLGTYLELKSSEKIEKYLKENPIFNSEHLVRYPFSALTVEQSDTGN